MQTDDQQQEQPQDQPQSAATAAVLTPERAAKLLKLNRAALVRKAQDGKLTAKDEALLQRIAAGEPEDAAAGGETGWAKSIVELAERLGVTRRTVHLWLNESGNPGKRANGDFHLGDWVAWAKANGKRVAEEAAGGESLRLRQMALQNQKLEHWLKVARGEYVPWARVEAEGGALGSSVRRIVLSLSKSAPSFAMVTEAEAARMLREKEDEVLSALASAAESLLSIRDETQAAASADLDADHGAAEETEPDDDEG